MKKNVLIIMTGAMELGGVERSLIGLLSAIDYNKYDVDLFLYGHHGPLFSMIDSHVNIIPECRELAYLRESFSSKLQHGCVYSAALRLRDAFRSTFRSVNNDQTWAQVMRHCTKPIKKHYYAALGFFLPFDFLYERVNADVKVGWVHTDYSAEQIDHAYLLEQYNRLDVIATVSDACRESFCSIFPQLASRVVVVENILPASFVKKSSQEFQVSNEMPPKGIRLLSIGRYCVQKNFDNVPDICSKLLDAGLDVYWYIIGFGPDEELIRRRIVQFGVKDRVILLGKKENPYPYIKACDLYIQPSRCEGKAVTVREAQMLGKPVIITDYPTASTQLENGKDGVIVPLSNAGCAEGIKELALDQKRQLALAKECLSRDYSNTDQADRLLRIIVSSAERSE